jgi:putative hemolysin
MELRQAAVSSTSDWSNTSPRLRSAQESTLRVRLAQTESEVRASQRLRYKVFADEMGADLRRYDGLDIDAFDAHCEHLIVVDESRDKVVGTYRILPPWGAAKLKRMYAETEFRIDSLRPIARDIFEVGRACIHPAYRDGSVLARLWSGIGNYVMKHDVKYLAGCASVPLDQGTTNLGALRAELMSKYLAPIDYRVEPIRGVISLGDPCAGKPAVPPLLQGYLRLGAWVCGEAAWDSDFDCADFFVLLSMDRLHPRYAKHFFGQRVTQ